MNVCYIFLIILRLITKTWPHILASGIGGVMDFEHLGAVERGRLKQLQAVQNEHLGCRWIETNVSTPPVGVPMNGTIDGEKRQI